MSQKNTTNTNSSKPTPAYLLPNYPYQANGEVIAESDTFQSKDVLYEINCPECGMSIRVQGNKVKDTYDRLMKSNGCIGCENSNLKIRKIDMNSGR